MAPLVAFGYRFTPRANRSCNFRSHTRSQAYAECVMLCNARQARHYWAPPLTCYAVPLRRISHRSIGRTRSAVSTGRPDASSRVRISR